MGTPVVLVMVVTLVPLVATLVPLVVILVLLLVAIVVLALETVNVEERDKVEVCEIGSFSFFLSIGFAVSLIPKT
jgi:competence protein ComGF